jgi:uncharacterized membrane protein
MEKQSKCALSDGAYRCGLLLIVLLAIALRLVNLSSLPASWDEIGTIYTIKGMHSFTVPADLGRAIDTYGGDHEKLVARSHAGFGEMVEALGHNDVHPPLHFCLLLAWTSVFGVSMIAARWLSVALGVLAVLVTAAAGTSAANRRVGLAAGLVMALMPLCINLSQDARTYPLTWLVSAFCVLCFVRVVDDGKARWGALLCLSYALGMYTAYMFALLIAGQVTFLLVSRERLRYLKSVVPAAVVAALVFLPWLPVMRHQMHTSAPWANQPHGLLATLRAGMWALSTVWLGGWASYVPRVGRAAISMIAWLTLVYWLVAARRYGKTAQAVAWIALVPWVVWVALFVSHGPADFWMATKRYSILIPGMVVSLAWALSSMRRQVLVPIAALLLLGSVGTMAYYYTRPTRAQAGKVAAFIKANADNDALLLTDTTPLEMSYYLSGYPNRAYLPDWLNPKTGFQRQTLRFRQVCLMPWRDPQGPEMNQARKWLSAHFAKVREASFFGYSAELYRR